MGSERLAECPSAERRVYLSRPINEAGDDCKWRRIQQLRRTRHSAFGGCTVYIGNVLQRFTTNSVPDSVPSG